MLFQLSPYCLLSPFCLFVLPFGSCFVVDHSFLFFAHHVDFVFLRFSCLPGSVAAFFVVLVMFHVFGGVFVFCCPGVLTKCMSFSIAYYCEGRFSLHDLW